MTPDDIMPWMFVYLVGFLLLVMTAGTIGLVVKELLDARRAKRDRET